MQPKTSQITKTFTSKRVQNLARQIGRGVRLYDILFATIGTALLALALWTYQGGEDRAPALSITGWGSVGFMVLAPFSYASLTTHSFQRIRHSLVWGVSRPEVVAAAILVSLKRALWVGLCMMPVAWISLGRTKVSVVKKVDADGSTFIRVGSETLEGAVTWSLTAWGLALICVWALLAVATGCLAGFAHAMNDVSREPGRGFLAKAAGVPRGFALWLLSMSALWPVAFLNCTHAAANYRSDRALSGARNV